jgi:hypothetical protein
MHWIPFVLAVVALVIFVAAYFGVSRKWANVALGLAFVTLSWMLVLILATDGGRIVID